jgi:hypothetical protein
VSNFNTTMDGRELFLKLADKVVRGELIITHVVANLMPSEDRRYDVGICGEFFSTQAARTKLDMKVTAVENEPGRPVPPARVTMPVQVRELIFDEDVAPIFDEDLAPDPAGSSLSPYGDDFK